MGNYLTNSFYKDSGCTSSENNNCNMSAVAIPTQAKRAVGKQSCTVPRVYTFVQLSAVLSKGNFQIDCKDNNSFLFKPFWNKRGSLPFLSKATSTANKSLEENSVDIYLASQVETNRSSVRRNSRQSYQHLQFEGSTRCTPRATKPDNILVCKSNPCYISRQFIDLDSLFFSTFLSMDNTPSQPKDSTTKVSGPNTKPAVKHRPGISFFVDLDEPYKQCSLNEEYKFTLYNDCCSLSESSCSSESDTVSCCGEDFIIFEEENDCYEFHVTHSGIEHCGNKCALSRDSLVCFKSESSTELHCRIKRESSAELHCSSSSCSSNFNQTNNNSVNLVWPTCEQTCEPEFPEQLSKNPSKPSSKKVHFETDEHRVVHHMKYWDFAYREARKGPWELAAADRCRFWRRITDFEAVLTPCLQRKIEAIKTL